MNKPKPTSAQSFSILKRSQRNMNILEETLKRYQRFNTSNTVQYISSRYSGFTPNISVNPWIPSGSANISAPSRSASSCSVSAACVPVSATIRQVAVVHPNHRALRNSASLNIGAGNSSGAKPKYSQSSSFAEKELSHKTEVTTPSACGSGHNEKADDEDVVYLYTVDSSSDATIVEEINLDEESEATRSPSQPERKRDAAVQSTAVTVEMSRKRKGIATNEQSRKRAKKNHEVKCSSCEVKYGEIAGICLYITRCGHLLCLLCVEDKRSCMVCGKSVTSYRKVYR